MDKFGMRAVIATLSPIVLVIVHSFLGFTTVDPVGPLVGQGLAYSCFAAVIWPSVPLVVPPELVGFAYGVVFSIQNMGMAVFPLIIATIFNDSGEEYSPSVEVFFVIVASIGVATGLYLNFYDYFFMNSILNKPQQPLAVTPQKDSSRSQSGSDSHQATTFTGDEFVSRTQRIKSTEISHSSTFSI